jgi:hypothetical protein
MAARGDQDLEHLLRSRAAQIAGTEHASAVLDLERTEEVMTRRGRPLSSPGGCTLPLNARTGSAVPACVTGLSLSRRSGPAQSAFVASPSDNDHLDPADAGRKENP